MAACEFLSRDYRTFDASELPDGTVVNMSVWDDSEAFTVEVGVPLKEPPIFGDN